MKSVCTAYMGAALLAVSITFISPTKSEAYHARLLCSEADCYLNLNREETLDVASGRPVKTAVSELCSQLVDMSTSSPTYLCTGSIQSSISGQSAAARRYYAEGNCIGFRTPRDFRWGQPVTPYRLRMGVTNC